MNSDTHDSNLAGGEGRASGREVMRPSPRLVEVARAYIEGLENKAQRLEQVEYQLDEMVFNAATMANYNRTLSRVLAQIALLVKEGKPITEDHLLNITEILETNQTWSDDIFVCACGHSTFDHDLQAHLWSREC
jgi:uncharacterized protein (DUF849 family)